MESADIREDKQLGRYVFLIPDLGTRPAGGIMNIIRHAGVAARLGAEVAVATETGRDQHGRRWFRHDLPHIRWGDRRADDVCVIPDLYTDRVEEVEGPCIVYMQAPKLMFTNFDYRREDLQIWTDSPFMLEKCRALYPGKEIPIVPNVVDNAMFPFIPQSERKPGMIIVFPRKGKTFIKQVFAEYRAAGGRYWNPKVVHGMRFDKMAKVFQKAEAFLASADHEGCALPPQECMACGVVVVGKDAHGANFCMRHRETAMVANNAQEASACLLEVEVSTLRAKLARNGYGFIKRYFPDAEPTEFWRGVLAGGVVCG